ncbi:hypothetical protein EVAR_34706_1 [Eumeta japonica]|uniref:Uncharacterized protein n=1 Tax=Eumeta variegata TaxID=151549 RepID=A0A4C1XEF1_EUMVA|nr:hypothetical protein EVAR_34706_1 [Eumeta japonica]
MMSQIAQNLTRHGGFAHYLYRFKLKDSPYCAFDPTKEQNILPALEDCYMFMRERADLEMKIDCRVGRQNSLKILESSIKRTKFLKFCKNIMDKLNRSNKA